MATKIDTIKLGSSEYEIDLKSTATPNIASLTTSALTVNGNSNLSDVNCNGNITLSHITGADPDGTIKTRYIKNINFNQGSSTTEFPLTISSMNNLDLNASGSLDISSGSYMSLSASGNGKDNSIDMDDEGIRLTTKGALSLECGNFKTTADNSHLGGIKPWYSTTGTSTYSGTTSYTTSPAINAASATAGRFYPIGVDANGRAFVNVPWVHITVDSSLNSASTNPVQNEVITNALGDKQDKLVSGENIKTINGASLLGSGSISFKNVNGTSVIGGGNLNSMILIPDECNTISSSDMRHASYSFKLYNDGLSTHIRQGTITVSGTSFNGSSTNQKITFSRKMPNNNYSLVLTAKINNGTSREVYTTIYSKTATDFSFNAHMSNTSYRITEINYIAILIK